ncbi:MAG: hypothetical protein ACKPA9_18695 [Microcystis sp.]
MQPNLTNDLNHILTHTKDLWEELRGQQIFINGGTGFFGCWLLESFIWVNDRLDLKASAVVLTRNPDSFRQKAPHLANHPAIQFHSGDVRSFEFPEGEFSYIIHGFMVPLKRVPSLIKKIPYKCLIRLLREQGIL